MAIALASELFDFAESIYTTCCAFGCNKQVKRGEKCECGMQN
jgi:hypothetical protein